MDSRRFFSAAIAAALAVAVAAYGDEQITVVGWNVESGGADEAVLKDLVGAFNGVDVWGFSEVSATWDDDLELGAEDGESADFTPVLGTTGGSDRLLIVYDADRFEELDRSEISWDDRYWFKSTMRPRSALVVHLKLRSTDQEFMFMVNHLYRGDGVDPRRLDQAKRLREWAAEQTVPVIAVGDYNFDFDLDSGQDQHNTQKGLGDMLACGSWEWIQPATLIKTHDSSFNSVLDFVFLRDPDGAVSSAQSTIIVTPGDFPDDGTTPDHRPVRATLTFGSGGVASTEARSQYKVVILPRNFETRRAVIDKLNEHGGEGWELPELIVFSTSDRQGHTGWHAVPIELYAGPNSPEPAEIVVAARKGG